MIILATGMARMAAVTDRAEATEVVMEEVMAADMAEDMADHPRVTKRE